MFRYMEFFFKDFFSKNLWIYSDLLKTSNFIIRIVRLLESVGSFFWSHRVKYAKIRVFSDSYIPTSRQKTRNLAHFTQCAFSTNLKQICIYIYIFSEGMVLSKAQKEYGLENIFSQTLSTKIFEL